MRKEQHMIVRVAAFLKRNLPAMRHTPRELLLRFVLWYWRDGRVGVVTDHGKIVAVGLARALNDAGEAAQHFFHEESGRIVWLDHLVSRHPAGLPILLRQALHRFGPREAFAGTVFNREGELRMLSAKAVGRLIANDLAHGLTFDSRRPGGA